MSRLRAAAPVHPVDARAFDLLSLTLAMVLGLHALHMPWWLVAVLAVVLLLETTGVLMIRRIVDIDI